MISADLPAEVIVYKGSPINIFTPLNSCLMTALIAFADINIWHGNVIFREFFPGQDTKLNN